MKGDTLSVFIEANRFPPAINERRYSILRAETDAVAERMLTIANKNNRISKASHSYENPDMNRHSSNPIYELEANEISAVNQSASQSIGLPVLPRISLMSVFNPFDESISSPPSPVPNQLKPAVETNSFPSTPLSSRPPVNYLPFIAPAAPFDPYKEKYEPHPAGHYGAQKFKNRQTISSAPFGYERPVTPTFSDTNSNFARFSDTSSSSSADQAVVSAEGSPSSSQVSCSPPRTPLFRPFKIPRKPLPPGAKPFPPPISYTPPSSPVRHDSHRLTTDRRILSPPPQRPRRVVSNITRVRSPHSNQPAARKPGLNIHKPLPPSPAPPANISQRQRTAQLSHHADRDREERRRVSRPSDHGMQMCALPSPEIIPRPVTAADRVRSELSNAKERFLDKLFKLRRL
ncbi:hypothetical protein E4T50_06420 [Aureobasidium sp. EXF-12298]|nr:hypothetical protein E4T50_06420 [Aureobasidium sp. EXF-12298]